MQDKIRITDEKGRNLLKVRDGRILVARFDNMTDNTKSLIIDLYKNIAGEDIDVIKDFLDYKNEHFEFCS
jgi:hypothetical protein